MNEAFKSVENAIIDKWKTSNIHDADGMVKLRMMLKLLYDVRANLLMIYQDPENTQVELIGITDTLKIEVENE